MIPNISSIKGIHPGAIIKREIKLRGMKSKDLASLLNEHAQTISAIINEKRGINPNLSIKLGEILNVEIDYFMQLQASYDVKKIQMQRSAKATPDLTKIRKILFWDTEFDKIDWIRNRRAIIKRIFERGNRVEIDEIVKFYGQESIKEELKEIGGSFLPSFKEKINQYFEDNEGL